MIWYCPELDIICVMSITKISDLDFMIHKHPVKITLNWDFGSTLYKHEEVLPNYLWICLGPI
jgi:hypothetical protein